MIERLLSTQAAFLSQFKPQRTNLYLVEYPRFPTVDGDPNQTQSLRDRSISFNTGLVSQLISPGSSLEQTANVVTSNPLSLMNIAPELQMMTNRAVLPGFEVETMQTNRLSYYQEIGKGTGTKRATFTFIVNDDLGEYRAMKKWYDKVIDPRTRRAGFWANYAEGKDITLTTLNSLLEPKIEIILRDCFPVKITGLEFTYEEADGISRFDVTFSVRDIQIDETDSLGLFANDALNSFAQGTINRFT